MKLKNDHDCSFLLYEKRIFPHVDRWKLNKIEFLREVNFDRKSDYVPIKYIYSTFIVNFYANYVLFTLVFKKYR